VEIEIYVGGTMFIESLKGLVAMQLILRSIRMTVESLTMATILI